MHNRASWHAWTEREWRDEVADEDEHLGRFDEDIDGFFADVKDMARMVVECTVEPVRAFAEGLPHTMAFDSHEWQREAHRWTKPHKTWRYARRRWRL